MHFNKKALFTVLAGFFVFALQAQDIFSPLSTKGVGQLRSQSFIHNLSMGGLGTAFTHWDSSSYSLKNPATSSYLKYTAVDFGVKTGLNEVISGTTGQSGVYDDFGLNYLSFAMVLDKSKAWTASFGIAPYSAFGYSTIKSYYADSLKIEEHIFSGGLSDFYLNTGFRLYTNKNKVRELKELQYELKRKKIDSVIHIPHLKTLSGGIKGNFIFGSKNYEHNIHFTNENDLASVQTVNNYLIRGFTYTAGLHYKISDLKFQTKRVKNDSNVVVKDHFVDFELGAYFGSSASNSARLSRFATSFFIQGTSITVPDTVLPMQHSNGSFKLPNNMGLGFMFTKKDKWKLGMDIDYTQWSQFTYSGLTSTLNDELNISLGGAIIPGSSNSEGFLKRTEYRMGLNYRQSFLNQNDKQVVGYSATFGLGMPFNINYNNRSIRSGVNLGFELGSLGNTTTNGLQERFYNIYLGVTIDEFWFQRFREK